MALLVTEYHEELSLHGLRLAAAEHVLQAATESATANTSWLPALFSPGWIPVLEITLLALAVGLMP